MSYDEVNQGKERYLGQVHEFLQLPTSLAKKLKKKNVYSGSGRPLLSCFLQERLAKLFETSNSRTYDLLE